MKQTLDIALSIPQRPPFVFIDTIETADEVMARTRFTVPAVCPLVSGNVLPLAGLLENMAQTCAAQMGQKAGNKIGYIGAVKELETNLLPRVGQTLTTEVRIIQQVFNICLMACTTSVEDRVIATATLKLATIE